MRDYSKSLYQDVQTALYAAMKNTKSKLAKENIFKGLLSAKALYSHVDEYELSLRERIDELNFQVAELKERLEPSNTNNNRCVLDPRTIRIDSGKNDYGSNFVAEAKE